MPNRQEPKKITNSKPIPHISLPFKEVMADVLKVKPPEKVKLPGKERKPCECGCGEYPKKPSSRFLPGHVLKNVFRENHEE